MKLTQNIRDHLSVTLRMYHNIGSGGVTELGYSKLSKNEKRLQQQIKRSNRSLGYRR